MRRLSIRWCRGISLHAAYVVLLREDKQKSPLQYAKHYCMKTNEVPTAICEALLREDKQKYPLQDFTEKPLS